MVASILRLFAHCLYRLVVVSCRPVPPANSIKSRYLAVTVAPLVWRTVSGYVGLLGFPPPPPGKGGGGGWGVWCVFRGRGGEMSLQETFWEFWFWFCLRFCFYLVSFVVSYSTYLEDYRLTGGWFGIVDGQNIQGTFWEFRICFCSYFF